MNLDQLSKNIGRCYRLRPIPQRKEQDGTLLQSLDDFWRLDAVLHNPSRITLVNNSTHHTVDLGSDNVREYRSPDFLLLRCQLTLTTMEVLIEPLLAPPADPPQPVPVSVPKPTLEVTEIFTNRPALGEFHSRFELLVKSPYAPANLFVAVFASSISRMSLVPQRTGLVLKGHCGKRPDHVFENLQQPYGRILLEVFTAQPEHLRVEWDIE